MNDINENTTSISLQEKPILLKQGESKKVESENLNPSRYVYYEEITALKVENNKVTVRNSIKNKTVEK